MKRYRKQNAKPSTVSRFCPGLIQVAAFLGTPQYELIQSYVTLLNLAMIIVL